MKKLLIVTLIVVIGMESKTPMAAQRIDYSHPELEKIYQTVKLSPPNPRDLRHASLVRILQKLQKKNPRLFRLEKIGASVEGRDIFLVSIGQGPRTVLMWSQMHGDEPTATNALVDLFHYLITHPQDEFVQTILSGITLYAIPMLNPDGAERFQRRNAQDIDINRDARDLATPEGRILKAVRDRLLPEFGFNLHDQNARRTVGNTNRIVAIALLVPPFDENENDNPQRIEAKKVASVIYQSLSPYIYGHIARYDASFMPRAFGDSMQKWGTKTVLIESGGWYENDPSFLVKMNFIAILEACYAIATGSYLQANPGLYDALPQNDKELFDLLIRDATLLDDRHDEPYKGDLGINFIDDGKIVDLGDLDVFAAKDTIEAGRYLVLPGLIGMLPAREAKKLPDAELVSTYLQKGYTTLLVPFSPEEVDSIQQRIDVWQARGLPLNIGFVLRPASRRKPDGVFSVKLGEALSRIALGVIETPGKPVDSEGLEAKLIRWLKRPISREDRLRARSSWVDFLQKGERGVARVRAAGLRLAGRGGLRLGDYADLVMYPIESTTPLKLAETTPAYILINGVIIWKKEKGLIPASPGKVLLPDY